MKKFISLITFILITVVVFTACSQNNNEETQKETPTKNPVEINFWHSLTGNNEELLQGAVDRFNHSQNEIYVKTAFQGGYDETMTKVQQALASNTAPDITMVERAYVEMLANANVLQDLHPFFDKSDKLSEEEFVEGLMGHSYFEDELLSLPFNRSTPILHINQTMLDEQGLAIPKDWRELENVANALVIQSDSEVERYGLSMPYDTWYPIAMITQSKGMFFNKDQTKDGFVENGVGNEVFSYLKNLQKTNALYYPPAQDSGDRVNQMFLSGKVGMIFQSTGTIGNLEDNVDFDYTTAFLPENKVYSTPTGGANIAMLKNSEHQTEAWTFMEWMMAEEEGALQFILESGYLPFTYSMVETESMKKLWSEQPNRKTAFEQLKYAEDTNKNENWPIVMHEFFAAIEAIMYDDENIDATLQKFSKETERVINK